MKVIYKNVSIDDDKIPFFGGKEKTGKRSAE